MIMKPLNFSTRVIVSEYVDAPLCYYSANASGPHIGHILVTTRVKLRHNRLLHSVLHGPFGAVALVAHRFESRDAIRHSPDETPRERGYLFRLFLTRQLLG